MAVAAVEEAGRLLVCGEAGVGKTTLLDSLAMTLTSRGFLIMRAAATAGLKDYPLAALGHVSVKWRSWRGALTPTERLRICSTSVSVR